MVGDFHLGSTGAAANTCDPAEDTDSSAEKQQSASHFVGQTQYFWLHQQVNGTKINLWKSS